MQRLIVAMQLRTVCKWTARGDSVLVCPRVCTQKTMLNFAILSTTNGCHARLLSSLVKMKKAAVTGYNAASNMFEDL